MRTSRTVLIGIVLLGTLCGSAPAQNAPAPNSQPTNQQAPSKEISAASNSQDSMQAGDQPISLAEAARLARANKANPEKPAKKYDDDNFPRSTPLVKKKSVEGVTANPSIQELPEGEMKGKLVLLDFWASWCGPCRAGVPNVQRMQSAYGGEDFMVVSVSEDDDEPTWRDFVAAHRMNWTQRFDADSSLQHRFQIGALPTYVLLDRDGQEIQRWVGEDPGRSILERIGPEIKRRMQAQL